MTSEAEIGYIAGLWEGEGYFTLVDGSAPRIRLAMTDYDVLVKAAVIMSIDVIKIRVVRKSGPKLKTLYAFDLNGRDAIKWMRIIRPHMGIRRGAKIDEIIDIIISHKPYYELGNDFCPKNNRNPKKH